MTNFYVPPQDKPLYGRTTGGRYEYDKRFGVWFGADDAYDLEDVYAREPDGLTDVRTLKVGDTVSSVEGLDALPDGTILREVSSGEAWQRGSYRWFCRVGSMTECSASVVSLRGAFTILWLPEMGEQA